MIYPSKIIPTDIEPSQVTCLTPDIDPSQDVCLKPAFLAPIYYGLSQSQEVDQAGILSGTPLVASSRFQNVTISGANNDYIFVAIPRILGDANTIQFESFPVRFLTSYVQAVYIDGVPYWYEVHVSEFRQNLSPLTLEINT